MRGNRFLSKINKGFGIVLMVYAISGIFFLNYYQYQINPDGICYISIAQKYLSGNYGSAINGYWGPLLSWLLVPFLFLGLPPLLAIKILLLIIGFLAMIGIRLLSFRFEMAESIRNVILFSLVPVILYFSFSNITPDLLIVCTLVFYLNIIFKADYPGKHKGIFCGVLGGISYLAKSYVFPFFVTHFFLFSIFHYLRGTTVEQKKNVLLNFLCGLATFLLISGSWSALISNKYKEITIGTSGKYNYALVGPESQGQAHDYQGFLMPPNETAVSAWEDPSYYKVKSWNPMQSWSTFKHQSEIVLRNTYRIICCLCERFSPLSITIIIGCILLCVPPFNGIGLKGDVIYPLVTIIVYSAGYTLVLVNERYLWIIYVLLLLMGGHLLNILFHNKFFTYLRKNIALTFFILSFIVMPTGKLIQRMNAGKNIYILSEKVKNNYNINKQVNIASNSDWGKTLYLSYYLNSGYYGTARKNISAADLERELKLYNIDYFFVWGESKDEYQFLSNYKEKTKGEIPGLKIYSLKE